MNISKNMSSSQQTSYLEIILGPMYASKTTRLVELYKQYNFENQKMQICFQHCLLCYLQRFQLMEI